MRTLGWLLFGIAFGIGALVAGISAAGSSLRHMEDEDEDARRRGVFGGGR